VPVEVIVQYRDAALIHIAGELDLPGFRKGHVPPDIALKKVGEIAALEEAVELFVRDFYPELIDTQKLDAVGRPDIRITKLAPGNPVGLVVRASVYPQVILPKDWKSIGGRIPLEPALPATDEEVEKTIEDVRKSRAKPNELLDAEGKPLPPTLPELNDEFAKSVGAFENLDALKAQIKKGIGEEKERVERDKRRGKIVDALLEKTTVAVPKIFIESEQDKIISQMREDVGRFGLSFEDYLRQSNKTEESVRNDFREQAAKRAKLQLTLNKIADEEKVETDKEAVDNEMKHALEHFPDARPELLRIHIESVLRNEKVLKLLEGADDKK
jgi:FKBP-type peptidyl-prolyl cis-trans isomerase (trigger factor)